MIPEPDWSNQSPRLSLRQYRGPELVALIQNHIYSTMMLENISIASMYTEPVPKFQVLSSVIYMEC